ncbi:hypothetical protein E2C01_057405 [Portunus trituberculatus]|uniref:Endonuclease/exonuclease/phosphatase domain-containing protein n=1 Tax=Portunus trituberculatus TaxID=210409 RepID=A0A5B7H2B0_PORTR|nr:hypothetical protein [Portunus trituberculatus]
MYIHDGALNIANFPEYDPKEQSVIMGDLNARHKELGSHFTTNANGVRWKAFLDTTETALLTGEHATTHVQGGRLDYVALINMPTYTAEPFFVRFLLSSHLALETTLPMKSILVVPRKRLMVPPSTIAGLIVHVLAWYSAVKDSFGDSEALYNGLLNTIKGFIMTLRVLSRAHIPHCWNYDTNPVILNFEQMLVTYQRCWTLNPANAESRVAMISFLDRVRRTQSLRKVWHHVNSIWSKSGQQVCDPDPAGRTQELIMQ